MEEFGNIGVVGLGLIGGSLCIDIKKRKIANKVIGFSRRISTLKKAKSAGIIDEFYSDFNQGIKNLDFIIISTPINVIKDYFLLIKKTKPEILITDVASIKEKVVKDAERILGKKNNFIGSHPITGSEKSGIEWCQEGLFDGKVVVVTPSKFSNEKALRKVKKFWKLLGSKVILLSPKKHDYILGLTSHLPHFIVFSLLKTIGKIKYKDFVGGGFKDTTRIGKSNPELWTEIFFENKKNLLYWIEKFEENLNKLKNELIEEKIEKLKKELEKIKREREKFDEQK